MAVVVMDSPSARSQMLLGAAALPMMALLHWARCWCWEDKPAQLAT
jgi:hypothetical protein